MEGWSHPTALASRTHPAGQYFLYRHWIAVDIHELQPAGAPVHIAAAFGYDPARAHPGAMHRHTSTLSGVFACSVSLPDPGTSGVREDWGRLFIFPSATLKRFYDHNWVNCYCGSMGKNELGNGKRPCRVPQRRAERQARSRLRSVRYHKLSLKILSKHHGWAAPGSIGKAYEVEDTTLFPFRSSAQTHTESFTSSSKMTWGCYRPCSLFSIMQTVCACVFIFCLVSRKDRILGDDDVSCNIAAMS